MAFHFKAKTRRTIQRKSSNYENPITSGKRILFMKDIASIIAIKTPANQSILTHHIRDLSLADAYNFGTIKDEIIRDRFVCGVRGSSLSNKKNKTKQNNYFKYRNEHAWKVYRCVRQRRSHVDSTESYISTLTSHAPSPHEVNFVKTPSKGADKSSFVKDSRSCGQTHGKKR